jgi:hypothetical protein
MEPISLLLIALFAGAGAAAVASLTWDTVRSFIRTNAVPAGSATVIRKRLASGNYSVVVGVFNGRGTKVASNTWTAAAIDSALLSQFGGKNVLKIRT